MPKASDEMPSVTYASACIVHVSMHGCVFVHKYLCSCVPCLCLSASRALSTSHPLGNQETRVSTTFVRMITFVLMIQPCSRATSHPPSHANSVAQKCVRTRARTHTHVRKHQMHRQAKKTAAPGFVNVCGEGERRGRHAHRRTDGKHGGRVGSRGSFLHTSQGL